MGFYSLELDSFTDGWLNSKLSEYAATGRMKLREGRNGVIKLILQQRMNEDIPDLTPKAKTKYAKAKQYISN